MTSPLDGEDRVARSQMSGLGSQASLEAGLNTVPSAAAPTQPPSEAYGYRLMAQVERYEDCLRTVCHHLGLPQSESGPCDDDGRYDRALSGLIELLDEAEAERTLAQERRFRAEAALQPFADAGKGLSDFWDDARRAASINWEGLKVEHFRKAVQALAVNRPSPPADTPPQGAPLAEGE